MDLILLFTSLTVCVHIILPIVNNIVKSVKLMHIVNNMEYVRPFKFRALITFSYFCIM